MNIAITLFFSMLTAIILGLFMSPKMAGKWLADAVTAYRTARANGGGE